MQDVSSGGACLRTHHRLRVGERIGLGMRFGLDQRYDIPARVVYANSGPCGSHARYGVSFAWISAEERRRLDAFVTERVSARRLGVRSFASLPAGRGFTIIEALIAIVALLVIILTLVSIVPSTFQFASRDSVRIQAATAAQQYLDALRQNVQSTGTNAGLPAAPSLGIDLGNQYMGSNAPMPTSSPGAFILTNNGCPAVAGSAREYYCTVTASWTQDGQPNSLTVESYVTSES